MWDEAFEVYQRPNGHHTRVNYDPKIQDVIKMAPPLPRKVLRRKIDDAMKLRELYNETGDHVYKVFHDKIGWEVVTSHMRFATSIAFKYAGSIDELISAAFDGLNRAWDTYDGSSQFTTYSGWWIHQAVHRAAMTSDVVRTPAYVGERRSRIFKVRSEFKDKYGRWPTVSELAKEVSYSVGVVQSVLWGVTMYSLDEKVSNADGDDNVTHMDALTSDLPQSDFFIYREELVDGVRDLLSDLTIRERKIVCLRFGIGCEPQTLDEIGREFSVTRERIRQIINKALRKLRRSPKLDKIV